ncbi:DNA polymerase family A-domain-containing protein [Tuber borchii]|uniref:DNA-directed DNA polymerase n=1 Tax=Tuber borchii TaxID=42251 RepID=A0A2T7A198_TUBBO|nr:DNA polymerase family A-domain-containing protein [Tuber borchii]
MSLHIAVNGMCSRQRPTWMKHRKSKELRERIEKENHGDDLRAMLNAGLIEDEEELWVRRSSINSLRDVAKFHCGIELDKGERDQFGGESVHDVLENVNELLNYCAQDVAATHKVYQKVLPEFLRVCSHPVSFAALRHLSSVILPVNRSWGRYIKDAEETYQQISEGVKGRLVELAELALEIKDKPEVYENDEWLRQLDWTRQEIKYLKLKKGETVPRLAKRKMPGMPKWYKDLFGKENSPINLSVRSRISPILLRLRWDKHPLIWTERFGWTFRVSREEAEKYKSSPLVQCDLSDEKNEAIRNDVDNVYYKLPHKDGPASRCATPLAKGFLKYFESQTLSSQYPLAREALEMNAACSYWISARERIRSQMVVYQSDLKCAAEADGMKDMRNEEEDPDEFGIILPQLIPMGTVTRRAVERTWLTASNAKKNRLGSELKAKVIAPPGYVFVGADVDSQELWIASLLGDAQFGIHGGNALGFMTLEGTKANGTDLHSKTAKILGISRNNAKIFNYGRIYGAGVNFASMLLREFNPMITDVQCAEIATDLYSKTKGQQTLRRPLGTRRFWRGGTESFVFNTLEEFADQERPRTPVLGAGITEALMRENLSRNGFLPSRINWAIQSSGVDYLHLLIVAMDYLIRKFDLAARLAITVHDEIRYLVKDKDKYRAAMALQVANVWTRAMFSEQIGINDLPQSCAFFSAVDIDHVFRKEVDMDCITPTNPNGISPGESLDISQLLEKEESLLRPEAAREIDFKELEYIPRVPVMKDLHAKTNIHLMKAQICSEDEELDDIVAMARKSGTGSLTGRIIPGTGPPPRCSGAARGTTMEKTTRTQKYPSASPKAANNLPGGQDRRTVPTSFGARSPTTANGSLIGSPRTTAKGPGTATGSTIAKPSVASQSRPYHTRPAPRKSTNGDVWVQGQNPLLSKTKDWDAKGRSASQKSMTPSSGAPCELPRVASLSSSASKGLSEVGAVVGGGSGWVGVR